MNNVTSLSEEREIRTLIGKLGRLVSNNPECINRTEALLCGELEMKNAESVMVSIRLPKTLVESLDEVSREQAYREKRKVTRSTLIAEWLDTMLQIYKHGQQVEHTELQDTTP